MIGERGLFCSLYADRASHCSRTTRGGARASAPRHRADPGLFGAHVRHLAEALRLAGITGIDEANRFKEICPNTTPASRSRRASARRLLRRRARDILCIQEERTVSNDNTVRYKRRPGSPPTAMSRPRHTQHGAFRRAAREQAAGTARRTATCSACFPQGGAAVTSLMANYAHRASGARGRTSTRPTASAIWISSCGIGVTSLGHAHPHVEAQQLWHVSNLYEIPPQARLAERLTDATFADRLFCNSGQRRALKLARTTSRGAPERYRVVTPRADVGHFAAGGQAKHLKGDDAFDGSGCDGPPGRAGPGGGRCFPASDDCLAHLREVQ